MFLRGTPEFDTRNGCPGFVAFHKLTYTAKTRNGWRIGRRLEPVPLRDRKQVLQGWRFILWRKNMCGCSEDSRCGCHQDRPMNKYGHPMGWVCPRCGTACSPYEPKCSCVDAERYTEIHYPYQYPCTPHRHPYDTGDPMPSPRYTVCCGS